MPKYKPSFPQKGGQMGMMQQIQKLQEQLAQAQEQLAEETVSYSAGGGGDQGGYDRRSTLPIGGD